MSLNEIIINWNTDPVVIWTDLQGYHRMLERFSASDSDIYTCMQMSSSQFYIAAKNANLRI